MGQGNEKALAPREPKELYDSPPPHHLGHKCTLYPTGGAKCWGRPVQNSLDISPEKALAGKGFITAKMNVQGLSARLYCYGYVFAQTAGEPVKWGRYGDLW